jgi:hypothetical protein
MSSRGFLRFSIVLTVPDCTRIAHVHSEASVRGAVTREFAAVRTQGVFRYQSDLRLVFTH